MQFGLDVSAEYFDVPRGRVLWSPAKKSSVIYHGNRTPKHRLEKIAETFRLDDYTAKTDFHYMIGDAVDDYLRRIESTERHGFEKLPSLRILVS